MDKENFDPAEIWNAQSGFAINTVDGDIGFRIISGDAIAIMVAFGLVMFLAVLFPDFDDAMNDGLWTIASEDEDIA